MRDARRPFPILLAVIGTAAALALLPAAPSLADGKLMPPRDYPGSLEERSQEAIIIFRGGTAERSAVEDLILKITVAGDGDAAAPKSFGWVVPFPRPPKVVKESASLFQECFDYVEARTARTGKMGKSRLGAKSAGADRKSVEVISRKIVGSYDVAVVRENVAGALNTWLETEGYQTLPEGEEVIAFYRRKGYVFACMKVSDVALEKDQAVDLHPLRFTFETGGRDGIYFPMKMTGLQRDRFDVNLHVFYRAWLNDRLSKFGYVHRGFRLRFRDWDSSACRANAGKTWSAPEDDPYLRPLAGKIPTLKSLFQRLHPGERFYLTNLQAHRLKPEEVREWSDDLWLFPYYTDKNFIPYDARPGGPAAAAWASD